MVDKLHGDVTKGRISEIRLAPGFPGYRPRRHDRLGRGKQVSNLHCTSQAKNLPCVLIWPLQNPAKLQKLFVELQSHVLWVAWETTDDLGRPPLQGPLHQPSHLYLRNGGSRRLSNLPEVSRLLRLVVLGTTQVCLTSKFSLLTTQGANCDLTQNENTPTSLTATLTPKRKADRCLSHSLADRAHLHTPAQRKQERGSLCWWAAGATLFPPDSFSSPFA